MPGIRKLETRIAANLVKGNRYTGTVKSKPNIVDQLLNHRPLIWGDPFPGKEHKAANVMQMEWGSVESSSSLAGLTDTKNRGKMYRNLVRW